MRFTTQEWGVVLIPKYTPLNPYLNSSTGYSVSNTEILINIYSECYLSTWNLSSKANIRAIELLRIIILMYLGPNLVWRFSQFCSTPKDIVLRVLEKWLTGPDKGYFQFIPSVYQFGCCSLLLSLETELHFVAQADLDPGNRHLLGMHIKLCSTQY